jgi:hypothetical protein
MTFAVDYASLPPVAVLGHKQQERDTLLRKKLQYIRYGMIRISMKKNLCMTTPPCNEGRQERMTL